MTTATDSHSSIDDKATNPIVFFDIALGGKTNSMITNVFQFSPIPFLLLPKYSMAIYLSRQGDATSTLPIRFVRLPPSHRLTFSL